MIVSRLAVSLAVDEAKTQPNKPPISNVIRGIRNASLPLNKVADAGNLNT